MNLIDLLSSTFTFDGVHFYKNHFSFTLFGHEFTIAFYAIAIVLGMIACVILARPLCKKAGLNPDILLDYMIAIIPISIICARLWYVLTDLKSFHSFYDVIAIWNGGNAIFGGVMGGALAIFIVSKIKKIPFFTIADASDAVTKDFPTPPFPLTTPITFFTDECALSFALKSCAAF